MTFMFRALTDNDIRRLPNGAEVAILRDGGKSLARAVAVNGALVARHAHGIDCCRDCFDGLHVHPEMPDDPTCKDRADGNGRCTYAEEIPCPTTAPSSSPSPRSSSR